MPLSGIKFFPSEEILTFDQLSELIEIFVSLGIRKIRLTGGEPLLRPDLPRIVRFIASCSEVLDLSLTTNGVFLSRLCRDLRDAGLKRMNISLDTLNRGRFSAITGRDELPEVLSGIDSALSQGFFPVKVNVVVMRGVNDDEIADFVKFARLNPLEVRFIELMPARSCFLWSSAQRISVREIKEKVDQVEPLIPLTTAKSDVAELFKISAGGKGKIGFISPLSPSLCFQCNRLRLKANGELQLCLHGREVVDLRRLLKEGADREEITALILEGVKLKPYGHQREDQVEMKAEPLMFQIGG